MKEINYEDFKPGFVSKNMPLILFLIFLVLKLTKQINWSWWWVTSPLWIIFLIALVLIISSVVLSFILKFIEKLRNDNQNTD
jgi:phosphoglycerol transferase MdoB-like AlkP superfamily enzyme